MGSIVRKNQGRHAHYAAINEIVKRSLGAAKILHLNHLDWIMMVARILMGLQFIPRTSGKILVWVVTSPDTFAPSYRELLYGNPGVIACE